MHVVHRECAKETQPPNMHTAKKATNSERNAGFHPIPIPSVCTIPTSFPKAARQRPIVNKLQKRQNIQKNRKKNQKTQNRKYIRKHTRSTP
jgi:hypothetical protein